ncbi:MAG: AAA family ATPase [Candidatus Thermoplasmatota archaeon]|uniref:AAA family ATPase n=1 Tax=Candidatus Sysuiplasma superficiale TaxID=2823368 RepID=A0A8J7YSN0_9ARCH|nr:AAA family ATPase [Candidatus Sysuiplasma superficiale]MCL4347368.1 AAA family ATPase [Candidatus Thermoplasmatota archaeon]
MEALNLKTDRIRTFIEGFDDRIQGGIRKGHIVLLFGAPGTMKSSISMNVLWNNARKLKLNCLYISLEETKQSLMESMQSLGFWPVDESKLLISDIATLRLEHSEADSGRDWFKILEDYIRKRTEAGGVDLLVLDSLNAVFSLKNVVNPRQELFHFFGFLRKLNITSFIISELRPGSEEISAYGEDFLADGTIALRFHQVGEADYQLRIRCLKLRHSRVEHGYMTLIFKDGVFSATPPISE